MNLTNIKIDKLNRLHIFYIFLVMSFQSILCKSKATELISRILFGNYVREQEKFKIILGRDYVQAEDGTPIDKELFVKNCYTSKFEENNKLKL